MKDSVLDAKLSAALRVQAGLSHCTCSELLCQVADRLEHHALVEHLQEWAQADRLAEEYLRHHLVNIHGRRWGYVRDWDHDLLVQSHERAHHGGLRG